MSGYRYVVNDGDTVYMAGQLVRNNTGYTVDGAVFKAHTVQVFKNVQASLESVGINMRYVLSMK